MINTTHKLKNIKAVLLHEFGHLFGYCLANKNELTYFCKPLRIDFGYRNLITPSEKIYHLDNFMQDRPRVIENTKNIKRTIAWFIEVISGCDFETNFEGKQFKNCFCPSLFCSGSMDLANLSVVRNISFFDWSFDDIYDMQIEYRSLLSKYDIYNKIEIIVDDFIKKYGERDMHILEGAELNDYVQEFSDLISEEMYNDYVKTITTFEKKFLR